MARDNNINKTEEQYRWLAAKCRETALTASDRKERVHLLATAQRWELIADRRTRPSLSPETSALGYDPGKLKLGIVQSIDSTGTRLAGLAF